MAIFAFWGATSRQGRRKETQGRWEKHSPQYIYGNGLSWSPAGMGRRYTFPLWIGLCCEVFLYISSYSKRQCRRKPKWNPRNYNNWPLNFLATFFLFLVVSRHPPEQQLSYRSRRLLFMPFSSFQLHGPFT